MFYFLGFDNYWNRFVQETGSPGMPLVAGNKFLFHKKVCVKSKMSIVDQNVDWENWNFVEAFFLKAF